MTDDEIVQEVWRQFRDPDSQIGVGGLAGLALKIRTANPIETDECICSKCGIRHGGRNTGGSF